MRMRIGVFIVMMIMVMIMVIAKHTTSAIMIFATNAILIDHYVINKTWTR